jgi:hypothetical protein
MYLGWLMVLWHQCSCGHPSKKHRVVYGNWQEQKPHDDKLEHDRSDMKTNNDVLKNTINTQRSILASSSARLPFCCSTTTSTSTIALPSQRASTSLQMLLHQVKTSKEHPRRLQESRKLPQTLNPLGCDANRRGRPRQRGRPSHCHHSSVV